MQTVLNRSPKIRTLSLAGKPKRVRLEPGANLVEDADVEAMRKVPYQAELMRRGLISVRETPKAEVAFEPEKDSPEAVTDLAKLKVGDAIRAVEACSDPNQLKAWADQDGRVRVRKAILERHEALMGEGGSKAQEGEPESDD